ncbi:MAG: phosphatase PAP2 family protein [Flavobacteriaceae bacterium]|nr:phosphatase PAP2 family protein [Flavobacteriaceae bacterium]
MFDEILNFDKNLFLFLNNLGSNNFDFLWVIISSKYLNILVFSFFSLFFIKKKGITYFLHIIFFSLIIILITDQSSNFFKNFTQRLRPCHEDLIKNSVRIVNDYCGGLYSFFSAHASNTFTLAFFYSFLFNEFNNKIKYLIFGYAVLVAYSRIYLGVHYPLDIIFGAFYGIIIGYILINFLKKINSRLIYK